MPQGVQITHVSIASQTWGHTEGVVNTGLNKMSTRCKEFFSLSNYWYLFHLDTTCNLSNPNLITILPQVVMSWHDTIKSTVSAAVQNVERLCLGQNFPPPALAHKCDIYPRQRVSFTALSSTAQLGETQEPRLERPNWVQTIKKQSWFVTVAGDKSSLQQLQNGPSDREETTHSAGPDWSQLGRTIWLKDSLIHISFAVSCVCNKKKKKRQKKRVNAQLESNMTKQKA